MKRYLIPMLLILVGSAASLARTQLLVANDLGRNGYHEQKPIAALMGEMAEKYDAEALLALGDVHHYMGVQSTADPLWTTNFELIYSHPELQIPWYPVLGNHEYRGNTQAVIDYSAVSRRWEMPSRYYTRVFHDEDENVSLRVVFIDTTPLIDKYQNDLADYSDVAGQDIDTQLAWLDWQLSIAKEDWVIVVGHHPIYADTSKDVEERTDMQRRVDPILRKYGVNMYICGHIHNFQHIQKKGDNIDYVVNSSSSLARPVKPIDGTVFCSPADGFSVFTADKKQLRMSMIDKDGKIIHTVLKVKK